MVGATAQGIRFEKSKLRYYAQDFSLATFSLVRGKEMWRIVGAQEILSEAAQKAGQKTLEINKEKYALYVRMLKMLKRLIPGEEKHEALFDEIIAANNFLEKGKIDVGFAEPIIMLRILNHLGYVRAAPEFAALIQGGLFDDSLLDTITKPGVKQKVIREINAALKESQL